MSAARVSPVSFLKLAGDIASFYGFRSAREIGRGLSRDKRVGVMRGVPSFASAAQAAAARALATPQEPSLAFWATPVPAHMPRHLSTRETGEFGLYVVGGEGGTGEIVILKTISAIATEWGSPIARVRLNALGDRDTKERYGRELSSYVRRRAADLDLSCRNELARNPILHHCEHESCRSVLQEGPRSVNFLSERSRAHFREVLEQVEGLGFSYELDDLLLGDEREQHVVFAIDLKEPDATLLGGFGGRYDEYVRRISGRKEGTGVSASIYFRKKGAARGNFRLKSPSRAPKVFFVQLGPLAKLQGLGVLDMLWRARVPVSQSFDSKRLSPQLTSAERTVVTHMLIMGQREALDGTIIVREMKNSSQTIVELAALPRLLKNLRA
jgi:histidyl-tRNA synthetase